MVMTGSGRLRNRVIISGVRNTENLQFNTSLKSLLYKTRTNTFRTNFCSFYCTRLLVYTTQLLKVRIPYSFRLIIGMAYVMADNGLFPTYLANSRHI